MFEDLSTLTIDNLVAFLKSNESHIEWARVAAKAAVAIIEYNRVSMSLAASNIPQNIYIYTGHDRVAIQVLCRLKDCELKCVFYALDPDHRGEQSRSADFPAEEVLARLDDSPSLQSLPDHRSFAQFLKDHGLSDTVHHTLLQMQKVISGEIRSVDIGAVLPLKIHDTGYIHYFFNYSGGKATFYVVFSKSPTNLSGGFKYDGAVLLKLLEYQCTSAMLTVY